jgi:hypothetical protein
MIDIFVGDLVLDENNNPVKVVFKSEIFTYDCYNFTFDNGESVISCKDHLWPTSIGVISTHEIKSKFKEISLFTDSGLIKIQSVDYLGPYPTQCISVDSDTKIFQVTKSKILTHNTDLLIYCLYRWALTNPGTFNYYFAPFKDQINDLVWKNGRMPDFLPEHLKKKYIKSINNTDQRIMFNNGSFIKCDGSDNYEKARGYSATGLSTYDETKDFRKEFHTGFDPNRAITDAPLLAVGSPGGGENLLSQLWDSADVIQYGAAFRKPSHMNPHISAAYLEKKLAEHIARDELEVYQQEYLAMRVKLGTKYIFPMLTAEFNQSYEEALAYVKRHRKDYDFFISADPGSAKCFAVLFGVVHRYDKHVIILDEIYETKLGQNSVGVMAPRILEKVNEINRNHDDWMACYDHAASWFFSELTGTMPDFPINFIKCEKDLNNKEAKLSMIKDMMLTKVFTMTDRCIKLYWEMENYKRKDNGLIPKENDHLCDALRYLLNLASYEFTPQARPVNFRTIIQRREFEDDEIFKVKIEDGYGNFDSWNSDN